VRDALGDAEGFCIRNCFVRAVRWARKKASYDPYITFEFDNRPHRRREIEKAYDIFRIDAEQRSMKPELVSLALSSSLRVLPLQAADLLAWEFYQDASDVIHGRSEAGNPLRKELRRLVRGQRIAAQIATRDTIEKLAAQSPDYFSLAADYFANP
jgi:hypothetical protein